MRVNGLFCNVVDKLLLLCAGHVISLGNGTMQFPDPNFASHTGHLVTIPLSVLREELAIMHHVIDQVTFKAGDRPTVPSLLVINPNAPYVPPPDDVLTQLISPGRTAVHPSRRHVTLADLLPGTNGSPNPVLTTMETMWRTSGLPPAVATTPVSPTWSQLISNGYTSTSSWWNRPMPPHHAESTGGPHTEHPHSP